MNANIIILIIKKVVTVFVALIIVLAVIFFLIFEGNKTKLYKQLPVALQEISFINQIKETMASESGISSTEEVKKTQKYLADLKKGTDIDMNFFQDKMFESLKNLQKPFSSNLITNNQQGRNNPFIPI
ncbi:hypothetical protein KJ973_00085 [Patescibacteria group bacterium]|nr:hypothetical protein [Patescibacteria group bacterium]MBU1519088.1 hypothetical protein [Patescibacteria group bacterium]MBU1729950.1 hypothetical protein [Patescibacteria group bacterium]MBU2416898.1 hypothetical protein [Patescibacteria group bacterium]MBU2461055.1 hypothetical protein [Patescibacteria group bacterium]